LSRTVCVCVCVCVHSLQGQHSCGRLRQAPHLHPPPRGAHTKLNSTISCLVNYVFSYLVNYVFSFLVNSIQLFVV
jgi:hypothetical protein